MSLKKLFIQQKCRLRPSGSPPRRDERGVEIVEFVGIMPWLLMIGLVVWQFMVFGHVALITSAAAREGARAAAAYESAHGAVARSVGSYDYRVSGGSCGAPGSPARVTVRLRIPIIDIPYVPVPEMWTQHTATMRCEPPWK
jgi:Flp pilus assembly protein TadG